MTKVLWYLLLSVIGVFHAEVMSWSQPQVLFNPAIFALAVPVYAVHYILFGDLMWRFGRRDYKMLYSFGALTGMYETFITKVYWKPPWNPTSIGPLGMAWFEVLWIGFTWHAFMSFLIPMTLTETFFRPHGVKVALRNNLSLPVRLMLFSVPFLGGILGFTMGPKDFGVVLGSVLASAVVIALVAWLFMWSARKASLTKLEDLMLSRRGLKLSLFFFLTVYIVYYIWLRSEVIFEVGIAPHLTTLGIDFFLVLLIIGLVRTKSSAPQRNGIAFSVEKPYFLFNFKYYALYVVYFLGVLSLVGVAAIAIPTVLNVLALVIMFSGIPIPIIVLVLISRGVVKDIFRERRGRRVSY